MIERELFGCYGCRGEYGMEWLAPVDIELAGRTRVVDLCLRCIGRQRERIRDDQHAVARATAEMILVALATPEPEASRAERAIHRVMARRLRQPGERARLLELFSQFDAEEWSDDGCADLDQAQ